MEEAVEVICPFCGEPTEVSVDVTVRVQSLAVDCDVCCHPFQLTVECDSGEVLSVMALAN
ncbi:MAG: CPXCG motif-containing cysteine-rich protein [Pedosphaera sp.]|nr:CPXCG motif-containing cysteine-rich protein [Pedosphaera sp.]